MAPTEENQEPNEKQTKSQLWKLDDAINKNEKLRQDHINILRDFCLSLPKVEEGSVTDEFVVALLHSSQYNLETAQTIAKKHYDMRFGLPNVFANRHVDNDDVQSALEVGYFCALPRRCPKGCKIILQALRQTDPSLFHYPSSTKVQFLTIDSCIHEDPTTPGYIFLYDMKDVSFGHMIRWGVTLTRKVLKYIQEGIPLRIYQLHFINSNAFTQKVMQVMKPMMSQQLWEMLNFHTPDELENLYKHVPRECLPQEYGGHLPDLETLHETHIKWLREMQPKIDISSS